jgi:hypothetical protein
MTRYADAPVRRLIDPGANCKPRLFALTSSAQTRPGPQEDDQTYRLTPSDMFARRL